MAAAFVCNSLMPDSLSRPNDQGVLLFSEALWAAFQTLFEAELPTSTAEQRKGVPSNRDGWRGDTFM